MYWNTVTPLLKKTLIVLMKEELFHSFRLVGGTSLSLQFGHRQSVDIDLFTAADYGSINFKAIENYFTENFEIADSSKVENIGIGKSYYIGRSVNDLLKVDLYYTDPYIRKEIKEEYIRLAAPEDIMAMKLEVIGQGGRKKDFWDLQELQEKFSIPAMIKFHAEKYSYSYTENELKKVLTNFILADDEPDPVCLRGKHWELIKLDFINWLT